MARGAGTVGGISVNVTANTARFNKNITAARQMLGKFSESVKNSVFSMKSLAAVASTALIGKFTTDQASAIDKLLDMSAQIGVTTKALAGMRLAAEENGSDMESLEGGLQKMIRTLGEAANGNEKAGLAFSRIGLSVEHLRSLTPDQQFMEIADAVSRLGSRSDQLNATFAIFGRSAGSLVGVLREGKSGLTEAATAAEQLGLAVSKEAATGVGSAIDAFNRLKSSISALFSNIAIEIAPWVELMSTMFTQFLSQGDGVRGLARSLANAAVESMLFMADLGQQAFAMMIRAVARLLAFIADAKSSWVGKKLGFTPASIEENLAVGNMEVFANRISKTAISERFRSVVSSMKASTQDKVNEAQLKVLQNIDDNTKRSTQAMLTPAKI